MQNGPKHQDNPMPHSTPIGQDEHQNQQADGWTEKGLHFSEMTLPAYLSNGDRDLRNPRGSRKPKPGKG